MEAKDLFVVRPTNNEQKEFIITIGKHLATTKKFKSQEEAEKYIKYPKWDTTFAMVAEIMESNEERKMLTDNGNITNNNENKPKDNGNN